MPATPAGAKSNAAEQIQSPSNRQDVERTLAELRKDPKVVFAEDCPRGWQVFAKVNSKGEPHATFVTPNLRIMEDFKTAHRFLTQNPKFAKGTPQEIEPGIFVEAEMQESDSDKTEWIKGRVTHVSKKKKRVHGTHRGRE